MENRTFILGLILAVFGGFSAAVGLYVIVDTPTEWLAWFLFIGGVLFGGTGIEKIRKVTL